MHYYAFISYSHEDIKKVRKFHKNLEAFSIPAMIRKQIKNCPKNLYPVFRDETDLSGTTLTPKIEEALDHSDYLIVICTQHSACSVWVKREIEYFLKHHNADCMIPVFLDRHIQKEYSKNFPDMLSSLNEAEDCRVCWTRGRRKSSLFEMIARIFQCYSPKLVSRYSSREEKMQILTGVIWFFMILMISMDIMWVYKENHTIVKYCRDIDFSYDWPEAVEPLNAVTRLFAKDYYICTYSENRIIRIEHVSSEENQAVCPGQFLVKADCMEFDYNNYWQSKAQVSRVVFRDKNNQILFVKNFSLMHEIVDLTAGPDTGEPYFLPDDTTVPALMAEEKNNTGQYSCRIVQVYNDLGQISQIWFLSDTFSQQVCDENGYYGVSFSYDDSGELSAADYLDLDGSVIDSFAVKNP